MSTPFDNIPAELKAGKQWVLWKLIKRGGATLATKVPFQVNGAGASHSDPSTWTTFDEAVDAFRRSNGYYTGIGRCFAEDDPCAGIDLDGCIINGEFAPWALKILDQFNGAYAEVSPSGTGVKLWFRGKLPGPNRSRKIGDKAHTGVEIHGFPKYYAMTGDVIGEVPETIADHQEALEALYAWVKPPKSTPPVDRPVPMVHVPATGSAVDRFVAKAMAEESHRVATASSPGRNDQLNKSAFALGQLIAAGALDRSTVEASLMSAATAVGLVESYGERATRGTLNSGITAGLENPRDLSHVGRSNGRPVETMSATNDQHPVVPEVEITPLELEVNDAVVNALARDPGLYQRGNCLVTILNEGVSPRGVDYQGEAPPQIQPVELATLRERITGLVRFVRPTQQKDGSWKSVTSHPPDWCVKAVHHRGVYPGVPMVEGVIEAPTMRRDGSILDQPGYDPATRLFYKPNDRFESIPDSPKRVDAERARDELMELVSEFPFRGREDAAVWLAALLSVVARPSFTGPAPLFGFDGNCPGVGKSKLADVIATIASGRTMPRTTLPSGRGADDETRKRITSLALAGERFTLIDNLDEPLGGAPLDAALTADTWRDRVLGSSTMTAELPLKMVWFASGNNLACRGDILRRVLFARLESPVENPEDRDGFKHDDLIGFARENRGRFVRAALTILRAYQVARRPNPLKPLGSFEDWTRVIASAVAWITGVNPLDVRRSNKSDDPEANLRNALVKGWAELPGSESGLTAAEALKILKSPGGEDQFATLRSALLEFSSNSDLPSARTIGRQLNAVRGRVIGSHTLNGKPNRAGTIVWSVETAGFAGFEKPVQGLNSGQTLHLNSCEDNTLASPAGFAGFDCQPSAGAGAGEATSEWLQSNPANPANPALNPAPGREVFEL